jgi:hypothetical protein
LKSKLTILSLALIPESAISATPRNLRGEYRLAHETAAAELRIGEARNDALLISHGHHHLGYNYRHLGEFTLARAELEQTLLAMSDPALRNASTAATENADQLVVTLAHLAQSLAPLGYLALPPPTPFHQGCEPKRCWLSRRNTALLL